MYDFILLDGTFWSVVFLLVRDIIMLLLSVVFTVYQIH